MGLISNWRSTHWRK